MNNFQKFVENPGCPLGYALRGREQYYSPAAAEAAWVEGELHFKVQYNWGNRTLTVTVDRDGEIVHLHDPELGSMDLGGAA